MKRLFTLMLLFSSGANLLWGQPARSPLQAVQYIKLANTLRAVDKSEESISLLMRALPAVQSKNVYWEAVANELLGLSYRDLNDATNALRYLERARAQYSRLKYVASGWAVNEVIRDVSGKNLYAGIQFGASDVKVAIFKTKYESEFYEKDVRSTFEVPNPADQLFADASGTYRAGQDVLRICLDSIQRYNIPNERVFIVLSSEVKQELARTPGYSKRLYQQLAQVLPNAGLTIDTTITPTREAELFTIGAIPRKVWPTTSALNIGGSSTIGGYFEQGPERYKGGLTNRTFHPVGVPFGLNTLVSRIESKRPLSNEAFKREAQRVIQALADTALPTHLTTAGPGLRQRRTVGLGGEIAYALVTYLHPERAGTTAVPITMEDVDRFKRLALDDYRALTQPSLSAITDAALRTRAETDIRTVQNRLNEKQLIAGALWLEAIMKTYASGSTPRRFVFIRNSDISWVTGKFLETINFEYESTIAKGAFYTR